ncbi:alkaline phosphatase [Pseudohaliea rubra]|uniref:Alkaline phosphatase n=1 Tax=Pseudohaliea rubra DSM 19751 TaxID=1265313 RepID=A0A095VNN5_9GAMM|nr:alkaline phosphatase [Pseudohaliea rubra]KGE03067.1 Alkaline phosphatase [Pseudohaliea rubra DSM 19751]
MNPRTVFSCLSAAFLVACASADPDKANPDNAQPPAAAAVPAHQQENAWFRTGVEAVAARGAAGGTAKNVVLFVGDGMGVSTVTAARILAGQQGGGSGEEHLLSFERFPFTGLAKTYNVDAQTPDSAGTMSAMMAGVKTDMGVFGVDERVTRGDCASTRGAKVVTALELAELAGKATGVVSTARLTHATPGATYAHTADRDWEDDSALPAAAAAEGCRDIASQFVAFAGQLAGRYPQARVDGIEVALGGGRRHFLPTEGSGYGTGRRGDDDLVARWLEQTPGGHYVADRAALLAAPAEGPLLGLFSDSHMSYEADRQDSEPSLTDMTVAALQRLADHPEGFFLMVEAGRIDHAHHAGNAANALGDTIELSRAVAATLARVDPAETLVIVTADHSHTMTMGGYPRRGNPILGKVVFPGQEAPALAVDGLPYTTLGYRNGRGFRDYGDETDADKTYAAAPHAGRVDLTEVDTEAPGFHQEALVPTDSETHGGEDVAVYAIGPGAAAVSGVQEQSNLFHVMNAAAGLAAAADAALGGGTEAGTADAGHSPYRGRAR